MPVLVEFGIVLTVLNLLNTNSTRIEVLNAFDDLQIKTKNLMSLMVNNVDIHIKELHEYDSSKNIINISNKNLERLNSRLIKHKTNII